MLLPNPSSLSRGTVPASGVGPGVLVNNGLRFPGPKRDPGFVRLKSLLYTFSGSEPLEIHPVGQSYGAGRIVLDVACISIVICTKPNLFPLVGPYKFVI